jgi:hypothetical protein
MLLGDAAGQTQGLAISKVARPMHRLTLLPCGRGVGGQQRHVRCPQAAVTAVTVAGDGTKRCTGVGWQRPKIEVVATARSTSLIPWPRARAACGVRPATAEHGARIAGQKTRVWTATMTRSASAPWRRTTSLHPKVVVLLLLQELLVRCGPPRAAGTAKSPAASGPCSGHGHGKRSRRPEEAARLHGRGDGVLVVTTVTGAGSRTVLLARGSALLGSDVRRARRAPPPPGMGKSWPLLIALRLLVAG